MFKNILASSARFNLRASVQRLSEKLGQRTFDSTTIKFAFNEISDVQKDLFFLVDNWNPTVKGLPPEKVIRDFEIFLFSKSYTPLVKRCLGMAAGFLPDKDLKTFSSLFNYFNGALTPGKENEKKRQIMFQFLEATISAFEAASKMDNHSIEYQEEFKNEQMKLWSDDWCKNEDDFDNGYDPNQELNEGESRYRGYTAQDIKNVLDAEKNKDEIKKKTVKSSNSYKKKNSKPILENNQSKYKSFEELEEKFLIPFVGGDDNFKTALYWCDQNMDEEFKKNFTRIFKMKSLYALKFSYANVIHQYEKANKKEFTRFDDESINVILEFGRLIVCRENKSEDARKLSNNGEETMNVLFNRSVGNNLYNQRSPEIISFFPHGDNSESVINMISKEFVNSYGKINLELIECLENGEVLEFYGFLGEHNEVPVRLNLLSNEEKEKLLELVNTGDDKDLNINTPIAHLDIPDTKSIFPIDKECEDYVKNNIPEFINLHKPTRKISYPLTDIPKDIYAFFKSLSNIEIVDKISSLGKEVEYELMSEATNYFLRYLIKLSNPDFWEFDDEDDFWYELLKIKKNITNPLITEDWLRDQIYSHLKINKKTKSPYLYFFEWSIGAQDKFKNLNKFISEVDFERIYSLFSMAWKDAMSEERMKSLDEIKINFKNSLNYPFLYEREPLIFDEVEDLPINKKAFTQAIEVTLWDRQLEDRIRGNKLSTATQNTIWYFKIESDPEICDFDGDDKAFFEYLLSLRESASSVSKLKEYLDWRIEQDLENIEDLEEDVEDDYREWSIGNKNSYEYQTIDEFINDVDFIEVVNQVSFAYRNSLSEKLMKRISELAKTMNKNLEKENQNAEDFELEFEAVPDSEDQDNEDFELELEAVPDSEDQINQADKLINEKSQVEVSEKFEAYWDLKEFKLLLEKGFKLNCKYFFLIKHIGIYLYVRKTDYKPSYKARREGGDFLVYAKGFDENKLSDEKIEIDSPEYKKEYEELRQKTDKLYQGDFCEWFNISNELLNEVEDKLNQGFINLKITILKPLEICNEELAIDKSEENDENFLMHGQTIKYGGGCPVSPFNTKLFLEYFSFSGQEKLSETYNGKKLFINSLSATNILNKNREEEFSHYCDIVGKSEEKEDEGNLDETILLLSQAIEKYPQFPIAYFKRGKIFRGLGEIEKAILDYDRYISIFPEDFKGYVNRGIAKAQGEDFQGAKIDLEEGLKINPKDQIALFHLKEVKKKMND